MRSGHGRWQRSLTGLLVVALAGTLAAAENDVPTERPPDDVDESAPFSDGDWVGTMSASGTASADIGEVHGDLTTTFFGPIEFASDDGDVVGDGELSGASVMWFTGAILGYITMQHEAWGGLEGDAEGLVFDGTHTTEGTSVALCPVSGSYPVGPNEGPFGPFDVEVVAFDCHRVFGDWSASFEAAALEGGWHTADIDGQFHADRFIVDVSPNLRDRAEQLLDDYNSWSDDVRGNVHADAQEAGTVFDAELRAEIMDLTNRAIDLEHDIRGAGGDELCAFGTQLGDVSFLLTAAVQELMIFVLEGHAAVDGSLLRDIEEILSYMGGIGPGAVRPGKAQQLEGLLEQRGAEVLEDHLVTDPSEHSRAGQQCTDARPCLDPTQDALEVLRIGSKHELTYEAGGLEITPEAADEVLTRTAG